MKPCPRIVVIAAILLSLPRLAAALCQGAQGFAMDPVDPPRDYSPYREGPAHDPRVIWWLDDQPREVAVSYLQPEVARGAQPATEEDVSAALARIQIHILPAAMRERLVGKTPHERAAILRSLTPPHRLETRWTIASKDVGRNARGEMGFSVVLRLAPETPVPDGEYIVMAGIDLTPDSTLGCLSFGGPGLLTSREHLIVRPSATLLDRAYVEYTAAERLLRLHERDKREPRFRDIPNSAKAAEMDEALAAARRLIALDPMSATAHEELCAVHYARHEAAPALAACRKAAELRAAGVPDLAKTPRSGRWTAEMWPQRNPLEVRIEELSQPEPKFIESP